MALRVKPPLNPKAAAAADDELYSRHFLDPRPNAFYDTHGRRRKLSAADPGQAAALREWMEEYADNRGKVEDCVPNPVRPGQPVQSCPPHADPFLHIDGIPDESMNLIHRDWIESPETDEEWKLATAKLMKNWPNLPEDPWKGIPGLSTDDKP